MKYRIAVLAFAVLYFGFPPAHVAEKGTRQAAPEHPPAIAQHSPLQTI